MRLSNLSEILNDKITPFWLIYVFKFACDFHQASVNNCLQLPELYRVSKKKLTSSEMQISRKFHCGIFSYGSTQKIEREP